MRRAQCTSEFLLLVKTQLYQQFGIPDNLDLAILVQAEI
jgi:hypothetical protein